MLCTMMPAIALKSDTNKPVIIDSLKQSLDMQSNVSVFSDHVIITQGTINIHAEKVIVTYPGGKKDKAYIEAFGDPVTFYQKLDTGKPIQGHSQKVKYDIANKLLTLTGNAYLEQLNSNVQSNCIVYLVQEQHMQAFSDKGQHVTTVLMPAQLQDKNNQK